MGFQYKSRCSKNSHFVFHILIPQGLRWQAFFPKIVFINTVFCAGSEYNIHFAVKMSEKGHIDWL